MADLSIEELQNVSHELSRSTPGSRRIAASPGFGGAAGDENISPVQKPAEKAAEGRGKPLAAASHKPNVTQPREARSQARINELEETVDELEGKLRAESSAKHELSIQIRKLKASLVEQEQKVGVDLERRRFLSTPIPNLSKVPDRFTHEAAELSCCSPFPFLVVPEDGC